MITTSKGFLDSFIEDGTGTPVEESINILECVEEYINEDCGEITIGEWAFLSEDTLNEAQIQLLEEELDEIDSDLVELDLLEDIESLSDEDEELLYEAVGTTIKRIAKIAKKKPFTAAKVAGKRAAHVAKKAGSAAYNKLKTAASVASEKSREYAKKARELMAKGLKPAADKAKAMAAKLAQKAKDLKNKAAFAIKKFRYSQAVKKARKAGQPVTMKAPVMG